MSAPVLAEVRITREHDPERLVVSPVWAGVDRPVSGGWGLRPDDMALAQRLAAAVRSGAALRGTPSVQTDVNGATYVQVTWHVMGRHLNADLRKIGY